MVEVSDPWWKWDLNDPNSPKYGAPGVTSTFIQWKGTDLCMDFICQCGQQHHFDGYFAHYLRCSSCQRVFAMPTNPAPRELTSEQAAQVPPDIIQMLTMPKIAGDTE